MASPCETHLLIEGLFRREAGRLVAGLVRRLGLAQLDLVEDAVHDALLDALRQWPIRGVPAEPAAWLCAVAQRRARDRLRRARVRERDRDDAALATAVAPADARDDQLMLLFACCDPRLPLGSRVALALKSLCGFSVREIARAFLASESAIEQRLVRCKRQIADDGIELAMVEDSALPARLGAVGDVLYALFAEGHAASGGAEPVREELVREAIRLGELLLEHETLRRPETHALLALFWLHASRIPARTDEAGELLALHEQDRTRWDRAAIARGFAHLERAAGGAALTRWHLEAGIAACHAAATDSTTTDWRRIAAYYDRLCAAWPSPIACLSRVIARAEVHGPESGLLELETLSDADRDAIGHRWWAARAELLVRTGDEEGARAAFRRARALAPLEAEQRLFARRVRALGVDLDPEPSPEPRPGPPDPRP
ncbi:MAG: sigma factor, ECF subfamily protein [Planctomycetes bacterium]|nr:sigma factor, ECF subfamily protein [Planctomycetota bacterium]